MSRVAFRQVPAAALLVVVTAAAAAAQPYDVVELGVLPGAAGSVATDINNRQQVVGFSGTSAFLWDESGGMRSLGVEATQLRINGSGIIAGIRMVDGRRRPFAWIDGVVLDVPTPPGVEFTRVQELTDTNILVLCAASCWGYYAGTLYDLDALTGGTIVAVGESATLGGSLNGDAYLRLADGRVFVPWQAAALPAMPGWGIVELIGAGGHFAGRAGSTAWFGLPTGAVAPMGLVAGVRATFTFDDINRGGEVVGTFRPQIMLPQLDAPFVFRGGRVQFLNDLVAPGAATLIAAAAINDAGAIAAVSGTPGGTRAVLLRPALPAPPRDLSFVVAKRVVALRWTPSPDAGEYVVEAGSRPGGSDLYLASVGPATGLVVSAPPGRYFVRVRARGAGGLSPPSNEIVVDVA